MADLSNPIQYVKDLNYKIPAGQEGEIMLALAKYAAQDSNFTNQQLGPKGQAVAKVTAQLCKVNPNFNKIIAAEIPAAKADLKEYATWSKKKLQEGTIARKAKRALALALLALGLGTASLSAAGAQEVTTPQPAVTMNIDKEATAVTVAGTTLKSLSITDFTKADADILTDKDDQSGIMHVITPFESTATFVNKNGAKGTIKYSLNNQVSYGRYVSKETKDGKSYNSIHEEQSYIWYDDWELVGSEGEITEEDCLEAFYQLGKTVFSHDKVESLEGQANAGLTASIDAYFNQASGK